MRRSDYRRSKEADLLGGLRSRDPLALAEAYHRTSPAAHACARRLLGNTPDAEALLHAVYAQLWAAPPETARLEGWVRSRCFRLGSDHLREQDRAPASPSLGLLLPDLPAFEGVTRDPAEEVLAALPEDDRRAVLLAHDQGLPTAAQDGPDAAGGLDRALMALAGPGEGADEGSSQACADLAGMADWTLGLLEADRAARVASEVVDRRACASRSRALRRGRRRLEGLPAAPDLGQRVLASVLGNLTDAPPVPGHPTSPPAEPIPDPAASSPSPSEEPASPAQQPLSSLGGAPSPPIPMAPLPSALDDTPTPAPTTDLELPGHPETEAGQAEPAPADTDRSDADAGPADSRRPDDEDDDHTEDLTPLLTGQTLAPPDNHVETAPTEAPEAQTTEVPTPEAQTPEAQTPEAQTTEAQATEAQTTEAQTTEAGEHAHAGMAGPDQADKQRSFVRPLLNALAILVVLAAGAGLGLLIGFLLVGR